MSIAPDDELKIRQTLNTLKAGVLEIFEPQLLCECGDAYGAATAALCWLIHEYDNYKTVGSDDTVDFREEAFCILQTVSWAWIMQEARFYKNWAAMNPNDDAVLKISALHAKMLGDTEK